MNFLSRNYGTLIILALIGGILLGASWARNGVDPAAFRIGGRELSNIRLGGVSLDSLGMRPAAKGGPTPIVIPANPAAATGAPLSGQQSAPASPSGGQTPAPSGAQGVLPTATPQTGQASPRGAQSGLGALRGAAAGVVQQIDGKTMTIATQAGGTAKVTVSDTTTYQKSVAITLGEIRVGDAVTVVGQEGSDGVIVAQNVQVGVTMQQAAGARQIGGMRVISGTVQKVDGNTLTVAVAGGQTATVKTSGDTRLSKMEAATLADVKVGEQVTILGQAGTDGIIAATGVQIGAQVGLFSR